MTTILIKKRDTTGAPAPGDLTNSSGGTEIAVNTADLKVYTKNSGGSIVQIGSGPSATDTLTNKTISGSNNTLSNIGNSSLTNSSITFGSTAQALGSTVSALNGVSIGATTASTGAFTNLSYTGTLTGGTGVVNLGSGQFYKDASGNVGIGTSSPAYRLDVSGISQFRDDIRFSTSSSSIGYTDSIRFVQLGVTERMRIDSSGQLMLGTTTSTNTLSVDIRNVSAASSNVLVRIKNDVANEDSGLIIEGFNTSAREYRIGINTITNTPDLTFSGPTGYRWYVGATERMRIDSAGNVGIGTSAPETKLHVNGSIRVGSLDALYFGGTTNYITASNGSNYFVVATNNTERMRIDSAGNVGIGTSSPVAIGGFVSVTANGSTGSFFDVQANATSIGRIVGTSAGFNIAALGATVPMTFQVNGSERMRIDSAGNVLIGSPSNATASPTFFVAAKNGTIATLGGLNFFAGSTGTSNNNGFFSGAYYDGTTVIATNTTASAYQHASGIHYWYSNAGLTVGSSFANAERMRLDTSGNLLVGTTNVTPTNSVGFRVYSTGYVNSTLAASTNGSSTLDVYSTGAGAYRFYVGMAGTIFATSTTISAISDQRLKENVQDLDVGLDAVMALKPRKFDWKEGKGKDIKGDRGWIAQEFEQVFPDMIDEWRDEAPEGEEPYKSVRADLIPVLVKAIQEQQAVIESLKARLDAANL